MCIVEIVKFNHSAVKLCCLKPNCKIPLILYYSQKKTKREIKSQSFLQGYFILNWMMLFLTLKKLKNFKLSSQTNGSKSTSTWRINILNRCDSMNVPEENFLGNTKAGFLPLEVGLASRTLTPSSSKNKINLVLLVIAVYLF